MIQEQHIQCQHNAVIIQDANENTELIAKLLGEKLEWHVFVPKPLCLECNSYLPTYDGAGKIASELALMEA